MEGQGPVRPNKRVTIPMANAITPDTEVVVAKPESLEISNEPALKASTMKIDKSATAAIKAAMAEITTVRHPVMDATALRDRSLTNIELLYDLHSPNPAPTTYSAPKVITNVDANHLFAASVVRLNLVLEEGSLPDVPIEVRGCASDIEALQKLCEFSQDVLFQAGFLSHNDSF